YGCTSWVTRTDYNLTHYGNVVVTDSPSENQPEKLSSGTIVVKQSILLQNLATQAAPLIGIQDARFILDGESISASCTRYENEGPGKTGALRLAAGEKARIDCIVDLDSNKDIKLADRDSV